MRGGMEGSADPLADFNLDIEQLETKIKGLTKQNELSNEIIASGENREALLQSIDTNEKEIERLKQIIMLKPGTGRGGLFGKPTSVAATALAATVASAATPASATTPASASTAAPAATALATLQEAESDMASQQKALSEPHASLADTGISGEDATKTKEYLVDEYDFDFRHVEHFPDLVDFFISLLQSGPQSSDFERARGQHAEGQSLTELKTRIGALQISKGTQRGIIQIFNNEIRKIKTTERYKALSSQGWRVPFKEEASDPQSAVNIYDKMIWISNQTLPFDERRPSEVYDQGTVGLVKGSVKEKTQYLPVPKSRTLHIIEVPDSREFRAARGTNNEYGTLLDEAAGSSKTVEARKKGRINESDRLKVYVDQEPAVQVAGNESGSLKPVALYRSSNEKETSTEKRPFLIKCIPGEVPSTFKAIRNWIENGQPWPPPARPDA